MELEGMELGGMEDAEDELEESLLEEENNSKKDNNKEDTLLAKEEEDEMEEARQERMELASISLCISDYNLCQQSPLAPIQLNKASKATPNKVLGKNTPKRQQQQHSHVQKAKKHP
eukprot:3767262-Ditylum_brightwellii.AAC.1